MDDPESPNQAPQVIVKEHEIHMHEGDLPK